MFQRLATNSSASWGSIPSVRVMLLVWLETISEPDLLPAEPPEIYTVADAYAYYLFLRENRS